MNTTRTAESILKEAKLNRRVWGKAIIRLNVMADLPATTWQRRVVGKLVL